MNHFIFQKEFPRLSFPHICNGNSNTASYNLGSLERRLSSFSVQEFIRDQHLERNREEAELGIGRRVVLQA